MTDIEIGTATPRMEKRFFQTVLWTFCLLSLRAAVPEAQAQYFQNGNQLQARCIANTATEYITGLTDAYTSANYLYDRPKLCIPTAATAGQVRDVVCKHLADHPEDRHVAAPLLALVALARAFPCAESK